MTSVHRISKIVFINACCCACQHVFMWDVESIVVADKCYILPPGGVVFLVALSREMCIDHGLQDVSALLKEMLSNICIF